MFISIGKHVTKSNCYQCSSMQLTGKSEFYCQFLKYHMIIRWAEDHHSVSEYQHHLKHNWEIDKRLHSPLSKEKWPQNHKELHKYKSQLRIIMPCFSIKHNLKLRKFLGKIITVFGEIDPQFFKFWQLNRWRNMCKKSRDNIIVCRVILDT